MQIADIEWDNGAQVDGTPVVETTPVDEPVAEGMAAATAIETGDGGVADHRLSTDGVQE